MTLTTVDAIFAALEAEPRASFDAWGVSASHLGRACDRELWLSLRWASEPEAITGRKLRIFERGDLEERRILADLRRAGVLVEDLDPATGRQWRFALAKGWLRGKADGICAGLPEAPGERHVLEIKSLKAADWRAIVKHGLAKAKPDHWRQLHAGMAGLEIPRGIYLGTNKDTEELLAEFVALDPAEAAADEARVLRLVEADHAPLRAADQPEAFVCRFCPHVAICHEGALPRRSCRTCLHFSLGRDGAGHCARFDHPRAPIGQRIGADCEAHLFLPSLISGEQIDADDGAETVTYRRPDGSVWVDGEKDEHGRRTWS